MRRNSGEVIKMSFSVSQSYHLRIAKTQGSTGRNCEAPPIMHGGAPNDPKTLHRDKSHQQKVFWPFLGPISYPWKSQRDHVLLVKSLFWEKRSWALQGSLVMATKPQNMLSGWVNKIHQDMEKRYLFKVENLQQLWCGHFNLTILPRTASQLELQSLLRLWASAFYLLVFLFISGIFLKTKKA